MNDVSAPVSLSAKIARLVEERGWNQEDFARLANLSRLTVRGIFQGTARRLHNTTVAACARALGLAVHELRHVPLENLLARMATPKPRVESHHAGSNTDVARLHEQATQPELLAWAEENPERARSLTADEWDELLSLQGTGGPLTELGVHHFVEQIERRRLLIDKVLTITGTDQLEVLEQFVDLLYRKVRPYADR